MTSPLTPPPGTDLVLDFANTHATAVDVEAIGSAETLRGWLVEHDLADDDLVTEADAARAREIRDALVLVLADHSVPGADPDRLSAAEDVLARAAERHPAGPVVSRQGATLRAAGRGMDAALGRVLATTAAVALVGDWSRFKACGNPVCRHAFYDRTRNGGGVYCSATCSSQVSMREHRRRQRATASASS